MSIAPAFTAHTFPEPDRLWLQTASAEKPFDARAAKARLFGRLPRDFDPREIDERFYRDDRLTILGIRVFRHDDPIFAVIDALITKLREKILADPKLDSVSIADLIKMTGHAEKLIRPAITFLSDLGQFFSGASNSSTGEVERLWFSGSSGYDDILRFESIDWLLQRWYERADPVNLFGDASSFDWTAVTQKSEDAHTNIAAKIKLGTAFVIMAIDPTKPELEDVLVAIKEACASFEIKAYRADEIEHQDKITSVILDEIRDCEHLIADLSYERPNVYYEIGYAHALNKRPILYRRQGTKLHFDLSLHNAPEYRNTTELRELLRKRFEAILGRTPRAA